MNLKLKKLLSSALAVSVASVMVIPAVTEAADDVITTKYDFGDPANLAEGYVSVSADTAYTDDLGYGLLSLAEVEQRENGSYYDGFIMDEGQKAIVKNGGSGSPATAEDDWVATDTPNKDNDPLYRYGSEIPIIRFAAKIPDDDHRFYDAKVTIVKDDASKEAKANLFSERKHLMLMEEEIPDEGLTYEFSGFVLSAHDKNGGTVDDNMINIVLEGENVGIASIEITTYSQESRGPVLWVFGDSTTTDGTSDLPYFNLRDYTGTGSGLSRYLDKGIAVSNMGQGGLAGNSTRNHVNRALPYMKEGDFAYYSMGHNEDNGVEEAVRYVDTYYEQISEKGVKFLLTSPVERVNNFSNGAYQPGLTAFADAFEEYAAEQVAAGKTDIAYVNLEKETLDWYNALVTANEHNRGENEAKYYFYPGDRTHANDAGSSNWARLFFVAADKVTDATQRAVIDDLLSYTRKIGGSGGSDEPLYDDARAIVSIYDKTTGVLKSTAISDNIIDTSVASGESIDINLSDHNISYNEDTDSYKAFIWDWSSDSSMEPLADSYSGTVSEDPDAPYTISSLTFDNNSVDTLTIVKNYDDPADDSGEIPAAYTVPDEIINAGNPDNGNPAYPDIYTPPAEPLQYPYTITNISLAEGSDGLVFDNVSLRRNMNSLFEDFTYGKVVIEIFDKDADMDTAEPKETIVSNDWLDKTNDSQSSTLDRSLTDFNDDVTFDYATESYRAYVAEVDEENHEIITDPDGNMTILSFTYIADDTPDGDIIFSDDFENCATDPTTNTLIPPEYISLQNQNDDSIETDQGNTYYNYNHISTNNNAQAYRWITMFPDELTEENAQGLLKISFDIRSTLNTRFDLAANNITGYDKSPFTPTNGSFMSVEILNNEDSPSIEVNDTNVYTSESAIDWLNITALLDTVNKQIDLKISSKSDGTVLYEGTSDYLYDTAAGQFKGLLILPHTRDCELSVRQHKLLTACICR